MESIETLKKPGIMAQLKSSKGFSLIEMAIVLVIIGIIVAAIIKGQDLMFNSRAKQLVATANSWKIAANAYMDRNGRFPGDSSKNGTIGSGAGEADAASSIGEIAATLSNAPANPVLIGGQSYWFYFGNLIITAGTNPGARNVMVACPSVNCATPLSPDDVEMLKALDTSIDGSADAGIGQLRAFKAPPGSTLTLSGTAANGDRANGVVVLADANLFNVTSGGSTQDWAVTTQVGAVWAFDKQF